MLKIQYTGDPLLYDQEFEDDLDEFQEMKDFYPNLYDSDLRFKKQLTEGLQGFVGVVEKRVIENEEDEEGIIRITEQLVQKLQKPKQYIFKMSQYMDFGIDHEYLVMKGLNTLHDFCPHFVRVLGKTTVPVGEGFRMAENPFISGTNMYHTTILFMEQVQGRKLYRYIKNKNVSSDHCLSLVKQILLAITIASEKVKFTHCDLHSNNVLIRKIPVNSVFLYNLDEHRKYVVPTYGYCPTIIDFGFSYTNNCDKHPMYTPLAFTKYGFDPSRHNKYADPKLFLTSVSYEMVKYKNVRHDPQLGQFRDLVMNLYSDLPIDHKSGQDSNNMKSISQRLYYKLKGIFRRSAFFYHQGEYISDLLQSLIDLPIRRPRTNTNTNIEDLICIVMDEFGKIEKDTGNNDMYNMYILKSMVRSVHDHKLEYMNRDTRSRAVEMFQNDVLNSISHVVQFSNPLINWEKLLCTLLCCGRCLEDLIWEWMKEYIDQKEKDYDPLVIKTTHEIYEYIDANLPSPFVFDKDTSIYVWDVEHTTNYMVKLPEEIVDTVNALDPFDRGHYLYKYIQENK